MRFSKLLPLLSLALAGCVSSDDGANSIPACSRVMPTGFPTTTEGTSIGDTAPDFQLVNELGENVCTRDYAGKVVLINFAAGWCGPCVSETPDIQEVYTELQDQGFEVLMVMSDDYSGGGSYADDFLTKWRERFGLTFELVEDRQWEAYELYNPGVNAVPVTILLDKDQVIRQRWIGSQSGTTFRNRAEDFLAVPPALDYD